MSQHYYYKVHKNEDPNSEIIFEGQLGELMRTLNPADQKMSSVFKNKYRKQPLLDEKYYVERIPMSEVPKKKPEPKPDKNDIPEKPKEKKPKKKSKLDETVEMVERMLDFYGNTIIYKDYEKVKARLNRDGYFIKAKHEPERRIKHKSIGSGNGAWEIYRECWILELVRKEIITNV